jgi:probable F420-dependent oxidoreductase
MKIGVVLPIAENEAYGGVPSYADIRTHAQTAEALGFDSVWVFDHLLFRWPNDPATHGIWECWTILSAIAEVTKRVELGSIVLCLPFRNPALLAKMAVTLDEISGGRLILGLGAGWHKPEFEAFGYPFDHLVSRFEEGLKILTPLLREGRVDFQGQYHQVVNCELAPRGPRPAGPPVLVASFGPRMLKLTAQYADQWNTAWFGQGDGLAARRAELAEACEQVGRDPHSIKVTVGVNVAFLDQGDEIPPAEKVLTGSLEEIAAELRRYADVGVDHLVCMLNPNTTESLARFAQVVKLARIA